MPMRDEDIAKLSLPELLELIRKITEEIELRAIELQS
jgi:hypothetical protein